ncbi:HAD-IIB family hydrolase [Agromyces binzhouensis]|uniref:HAD-IIB family hydrolase n=1 Tax=Agromyces binzhouensis TaxID=1817495 RepID=UPI003624E91C
MAVASVSLLPGRRELTDRPRLVAIDVDHTLIRSDGSLATATVHAVGEARSAGIVVALASSRPPGGLWQYLEPLGLIEPAAFVAFQGALVGTFDAAGSLIVHATSPLDAGDAAAAAAAAKSIGLTTNWYTADGWFVDALTDSVLREAGIVNMQPELARDVTSLPAPLKLLFIAERSGQIEALGPVLPASVTAEMSNPAYLEVTAAGVDKSTGVRFAASRSGIELKEVVAIGDGRNDLGLFRRVGASIAPANADPTVLAEADYLTASNNDDGVAVALRWLAGLGTR